MNFDTNINVIVCCNSFASLGIHSGFWQRCVSLPWSPLWHSGIRDTEALLDVVSHPHSLHNSACDHVVVCIQGETFDCPERVPFRLTHNMETAMGPMGKEGIFRKTCEVTMKVMRDQREPLMR